MINKSKKLLWQDNLQAHVFGLLPRNVCLNIVGFHLQELSSTSPFHSCTFIHCPIVVGPIWVSCWHDVRKMGNWRCFVRCWLSSDDLTQEDRAEARFPELLGRGSSSGDTATRTSVLEDTTDPKQKPRVRSGRPKRVVTEAGVRVKRLGDTTLVLRPGKIKPQATSTQVCCKERPARGVLFVRRTHKANRPAAAKFAQQQLDQRGQRFKPVKPQLTAFIRRFHDLRKKKETKPFGGPGGSASATAVVA